MTPCSSPRCRRRRGRTGSACQAGCHAQPRAPRRRLHRQEARGAIRWISLGWSSSDADVDAFLGALPGVVERARQASQGPDDRPVARRRRDERGVTPPSPPLAWSRPVTRSSASISPSRSPPRPARIRPRLLHDRGRRRCPPSRRSPRHPVLRVGHGRAVPRGRHGGLRGGVCRGPHPNPRLRCNEKIKFAALLDKALALGFDAVAAGHYAPDRGPPTGNVNCTVPSMPPDQSYVNRCPRRRTNSPTLFRSATPTKPAIVRRRPPAASRSPKPDSHADICFIPTATPADSRGPPRRAAGEPGHDRWRGGRDARRFLRFHRRAAGTSASTAVVSTASRASVVDVDVSPNRVVIGTARACSASGRSPGEHARWCGPAPIGTIRAGAQVRAHGEGGGLRAYQGPEGN